MQLKKNLLNLIPAAMLAVGAVACGDDDENGNGNGNADAGNGGGDTGNGGTPCYQEEAVNNGQVEFTEDNSLTIMDTLAIMTSAPAPTTSLPSGFENAAYHGAVDPSAATGWWEGWTYINSAADGTLPGSDFHPLEAEIGDTITGAEQSGCGGLGFGDGGTVTIFGEEFPVCVIDADIEADVSLPNNHVFILDGTINVGTGDAQLAGGDPTTNVTLTIAPGTQIYAVAGTASALVVTRGSEIDAQGTADTPIIFGAVEFEGGAITGDPTDLTGRGDWGGVVLSGFGVNNNSDENGELTSEAAPPDQERYFGGDDNGDDSGIMTYVIIAESGFEFRENEEVQGLTLEAVGSGTTLDFIQIIGSEDDCIEWFGGEAGLTHGICNGVDDDALDIDEGYVGNIQFVIIRQGSGNGDHGIESDSKFDQLPISAPNIANITIFGNDGSPGTDTRGALHREGFAGKVFRSVYTDDLLAGGAFDDGCFDIDDLLPAELQYRDMVFNCTPEPLSSCVGDDE